MKVLVVEDELALADALKMILEAKGMTAETVHDGESALEAVKVRSFDVIILDVMMTGMDGFTVVRKMRERRIDTPVLMLTAKTTTPDKVMGLNAGADDYMTKPFETEELLARVNALARRSGTVAMDELCFEDLTLDLGSARLSCGSEAVQLSRREFEVARMFFASPRSTITKESLIVHVWGIDSEATDNNVEAYISFLRKKLKFLKSAVMIRNIQKIGYRLEVQS